MGEILQRMDTALSGEREDYRRTWLQGKGNDYFKVLLWILYGFKESFHIQYRQGEAISQAHLQGVDSQTLKTIRESSFPSQPPWRYQRQKDNIGLLTIKTFQAKAEEFQRFLGTSFKQIRKEGIEYLIIDLRGNRGGSSDLADKLLSYLSPKPFNVTPWIQIRVSRQAKDQFKQRVPGLVRWLPVQNLSPRGRAVWKAKEGSVITFEEKPVKPKAEHQRYHGKIYLLIDEGTFSTAAILADVIHRHGMGTLIGRETGGLAGCTWGEPLFFETPHCDVRFSVAAMQFQQAEALSDVNGQGVIPHFSVVNELSHTIQKNDAILEKAMTLISSDMEQRGTE
jgi:C-terminal processing protease CtpA/Prc